MRNLIRPTLATALTVFVSLQTVGVPLAYAKIPAQKAQSGQSLQKGFQIPSVLETNLKTAIAEVYGAEQTEPVYQQVLALIEKNRQQRSVALQKEDLSRTSDWYKQEVVYMFYAEQFGVNSPEQKNKFKDLIGMLPYLKELGVTTIYILPFLDSSMGDAGFDVRDPKNVRADLGGLKEFQAFAEAAHQQGLKIKSDLILNHFSDQHEWFQQALKGDLSKLDYFVVTDHKPESRKYTDPQKGVVVDYKEADGSISSRRLIFPDISEDHYRKQTINGKDYYFYHTFYPFQLDINWKNPNVLYDVLDVIGYWSNQGIDIFRMDAIPYFIKQPGTNGENLPQTHAIVKILSAYTQALGPRSVIQAEACQWPKDILPYFGKEQKYNFETLGATRPLTRTDEVQIAYNFPYMPALWASMLTGDNQHFWSAYEKTPAIPNTAAWAVFLRVHDELTLEMVDIQTRELIYKTLLPKGAEFRKGLGVSGRVADFLDNDPQRIAQAFAILLSLPGVPIIYYGDEIGARNNWDYAKNSAKEREWVQKQKNKDIQVLSFFDSRDINRGPILKDNFYQAAKDPKSVAGQVYQKVKQDIALRKQNPAFTLGKLEPVQSSESSVFSYLRSHDSQTVLVANNLKGETSTVKLSLPEATLKKIAKQTTLKDLQSGQPVAYQKTQEGIELKLSPYQVYWLVL